MDHNNTSCTIKKAPSDGAWNLNDLYSSIHDHAIDKDKKYTLHQQDDLLKFWNTKNQESLTAPDYIHMLTVSENLTGVLGKLGSYAFLYRATNVLDTTANVFFSTIQDFSQKIHMSLAPIELSFIHVSDQMVQQIHDLNPKYSDYLTFLRRFKDHTLKDDLEKLMIDKDPTTAWIRLFDQTIAACDFPWKGTTIKETELLNHFFDQKPENRKEAAHSLNQVLSSKIETFALIYNTIIKDTLTNDQWRHYKNPEDSMHLSNHVSNHMVDSMVSSIVLHYPKTSHRYYALKAKLLGSSTIPYWDRMAPIQQFEKAEKQTPYTFDEAKDIVLHTYEKFSPMMGNIAQQFFDNHWIDIYPKEGKMPGAFAHPTVTQCHPYLLLNFAGKPRDVMTLAHEMGHGIHQMLSRDNGNLMAHAPLVFAETASVFGEMLTFQHLLQHQDDQGKKRLLSEKIEDMLATIVRQTSFYQFEKACFDQRKKQEITPQQFGTFWSDITAQSYGKAIILDDTFRNTWSYVPHFIHSPFYVYSYAFGNCLVNALYTLFQNGIPDFEKKYIQFLSLGGRITPKKMEDIFGIRLSDQTFWDNAQQPLINLISQLKDMI